MLESRGIELRVQFLVAGVWVWVFYDEHSGCAEPELLEALSLERRVLGARVRVSSWRHVGDGNGSLAELKIGFGFRN